MVKCFEALVFRVRIPRTDYQCGTLGFAGLKSRLQLGDSLQISERQRRQHHLGAKARNTSGCCIDRFDKDG